MLDDLRYESLHWQNIRRYQQQVKRVYVNGIDRITTIYGQYDFKGGQLDLSNQTSLKSAIDRQLQRMAGEMYQVIDAGITQEWGVANIKNDILAKRYLGDRNLPPDLQARYFGRNSDALIAFKTRVEGGLKLSQRVWNMTNGFAVEIERGMAIGVSEGRSAAGLATDMKQYLNEPDRLFRRVRDAKGNLKLSKAASEYHPGRGVYRSSYQNALRMTRTETNKAYRVADNKRFQQLDFVIGYRVNRSVTEYDCDVCGTLEGDYPKTFIFDSWHPNCRCYVTSILASDDEFWDSVDKGLAGEDYEFEGTLKDLPTVPEEYMKYFEQNP